MNPEHKFWSYFSCCSYSNIKYTYYDKEARFSKKRKQLKQQQSKRRVISQWIRRWISSVIPSFYWLGRSIKAENKNEMVSWQQQPNFKAQHLSYFQPKPTLKPWMVWQNIAIYYQQMDVVVRWDINFFPQVVPNNKTKVFLR